MHYLENGVLEVIISESIIILFKFKVLVLSNWQLHFTDEISDDFFLWRIQNSYTINELPKRFPIFVR